MSTSKFRYYIVDMFDGTITGTNNENTAQSYSFSEGFFVVDSQTNEWLMDDGTREEVKEKYLSI